MENRNYRIVAPLLLEERGHLRGKQVDKLLMQIERGKFCRSLERMPPKKPMPSLLLRICFSIGYLIGILLDGKEGSRG